MEPMLTLIEVTQFLKVSRDTIEKEINDLRLTATKVRGQWRFTQEAIDDYLESRTIKAKRKKLTA